MANKFLLIGILIPVLTAVFLFFWQRFPRDDFDLPTGGKTERETITVRNEEAINQEAAPREEFMQKEIMITDGVKHSVPLEEIVGGGPPKDGIPSIDEPKFISIKESGEWLSDEEPGISFSRGETHRFYPYQILVWHEIVNDTAEGERILVTYCPLCLSGFVFDPLVKGERVEFGTSGKLWKSNLAMYDRKTESLWPQILGEAVVGEMTGTKLKVLPSDQVRFGNWKRLHPSGQVLSRDTGALRFYGSNPYGDYFSAADFSLRLARPTDTRLPNDAFVFGIMINNKAKAYHMEAVKRKGIVEDIFEDTSLVLRYDKELDAVRMFKRLPDGREERINPLSAFWFSWVSAHPDTELYK